MEYGAITSHIDVAQVALYAFWVFFAGLIVYLHRENKREGYPLIAEDRRSDRVKVQGWPAVPAPKTFRLEDGRDYLAPPGNTAEPPLGAVAPQPWPGSPLIPLGDPLRGREAAGRDGALPQPRPPLAAPHAADRDFRPFFG